MTDRLALLREEIQAEMSMRCSVIQREQAMVEVLRGVLARMDRIERDHPAEVAAVEPAGITGRAARRDLRAEIRARLPADAGRGLSLTALAASIGNTESATKRALEAMIRKGLIDGGAGVYYRRAEQAPLAEAAQ